MQPFYVDLWVISCNRSKLLLTLSPYSFVRSERCDKKGTIVYLNTAYTRRSFATTVSQLKICDFSGETFKGFEVL